MLSFKFVLLADSAYFTVFVIVCPWTVSEITECASNNHDNYFCHACSWLGAAGNALPPRGSASTESSSRPAPKLSAWDSPARRVWLAICGIIMIPAAQLTAVLDALPSHCGFASSKFGILPDSPHPLNKSPCSQH